MSRRVCAAHVVNLSLENRLENHIGSNINVCLSYIAAAVKAIKKEDEKHYYGLEHELDV